MTDQITTAQGTRAKWLRTMDFAAPRAFGSDQLARLRAMQFAFTVAAKAELMTDLELDIDITLIDARELSWREAHADAASAGYGVEVVTDAGTSMYLTLDPPLAARIVEALLGGGSETSGPPRPLTATDLALLRQALGVMSGALARVWQDAVGEPLRVGSHDFHRAFKDAQDHDETTLCVACEVKFQGTLSILHILLPTGAIAPVAERLTRPDRVQVNDDPDALAAVQSRVGQADVVVRAEVAAIPLTPREIIALRPGDVLALHVDAAADVRLVVDGVTLQHGRAGRSGAHRAIQVTAGSTGDRNA